MSGDNSSEFEEFDDGRRTAIAPMKLIQYFLSSSVEKQEDLVFSTIYSYAMTPAQFTQEVINPVYPPPEVESVTFKVNCKRVERVLKCWIRLNNWDLLTDTALMASLTDLVDLLLKSRSDSLNKLGTVLNISLQNTRVKALNDTEQIKSALAPLLDLQDRVKYRPSPSSADGHVEKVSSSDSMSSSPSTPSALSAVDHDDTHFSSYSSSLSSSSSTSVTATPSNDPEILLFNYSPSEIAAQLTHLEALMIYHISPAELFHRAFEKPERSPNLQRCVARFNQVTEWVRTEILSASKIEDRIDVLIRFIELAHQFYELNNFSGVLQVVSALEITAISRLQNTWKNIGAKYAEKYEKLAALSNPEMNYRNYRAELAEKMSGRSAPFLPYVGCWMKDLTFIEEVPTLTERRLLNWSKMEQIHGIVEILERAKRCPYAFEVDEGLQEFLLSRPTMEEKEQYRVSKLLEPGGQASGSQPKIKGTYKTREKEREKRALRLKKSQKPSGAISEPPEGPPSAAILTPFDMLQRSHSKFLSTKISVIHSQSNISRLLADNQHCDRVLHDVLQANLPLFFTATRPDEPTIRTTLFQIAESAVKVHLQQLSLDCREQMIQQLKSASQSFLAAQLSRNAMLRIYLQQLAGLLHLLQDVSLKPYSASHQLLLDYSRQQLAVLIQLVRQLTESPLKIQSLKKPTPLTLRSRSTTTLFSTPKTTRTPSSYDRRKPSIR